MRLTRTAALLAFGLVSGAHAETLKLGIVAPLTGGGAAWGIANAKAAQIAAAEVNGAGGLAVAGKRYEIAVIPYDDQFKTNDAVAAYNRLVHQDNVRFVVVQTSNGAMALKSTIDEDNVVALSAGYGAKVVDPSNKHLFRYSSGPRDYMPGLIAWMKDNLAGRRVAQINPNIEGGFEQAELANRLYKDNGFEVIATEMAELTLKDFQPLLTKIIALKPDIIDLGGNAPATTGLMVRQARELGFKGQFIKTGGPGANEIVAAAGKEAAEGLICLLYADPANPGYQRLVAAYRKDLGQDPNEMLLPAYDGIRVMLGAVQRAGTVDDADKVAAAFSQVLPMQSTQCDELVLAGEKNYGANREIGTVSYVGRITNGVPVVAGKVR